MRRMRHTDFEKIFENLEKNALSIARKTYGYDLYNKLHDFGYYRNWKEQKFAVWIDVKDPRPSQINFDCWEVRGEVFIDTDGNKTYKIRFPFHEPEHKAKYYPCSQTLAGMMREMETWRLKFIREGYMNLCNLATEQLIDSLP